MGRRNSGSKLGNLLGGVFTFFLVGLTIVGTVAGIKYVVDNDLFGSPTSDPSIITTSDEPTTSEAPITSDEPITSETPTTSEEPVTSEEPSTSEDPNPALTAFMNQQVITHFKLDTWEGENESFFTSKGLSKSTYKTITIPGFLDGASAYFNSVRYEATTATALKFGFPTTVTSIHTNNDFRGGYTYASYMIMNGIHEFDPDRPIDISIYDANGELTNTFVVYVRTDNHLDWTSIANLDSFKQNAQFIQFAIAYQTNNKSNSAMLTYLSIQMSPLYGNNEQLYRLVSYTGNFHEETNYGDGWQVVRSEVVGELNMHYGILNGNYHYIDIKKVNDYPYGYILGLALNDYVVGTFANIDINSLVPGVNVIKLTPVAKDQVYDFTYEIVQQRPFYESDFK